MTRLSAAFNISADLGKFLINRAIAIGTGCRIIAAHAACDLVISMAISGMTNEIHGYNEYQLVFIPSARQSLLFYHLGLTFQPEIFY